MIIYPSHPAILKILQYLSLQSKKLNIPMSICGEVTNNMIFKAFDKLWL